MEATCRNLLGTCVSGILPQDDCCEVPAAARAISSMTRVDTWFTASWARGVLSQYRSCLSALRTLRTTIAYYCPRHTDTPATVLSVYFQKTTPEDQRAWSKGRTPVLRCPGRSGQSIGIGPTQISNTRLHLLQYCAIPPLCITRYCFRVRAMCIMALKPRHIWLAQL